MQQAGEDLETDRVARDIVSVRRRLFHECDRILHVSLLSEEGLKWQPFCTCTPNVL